jgi:hypothetical protein
MGIKNALPIINQVVEVVFNWSRYASEVEVKEVYKDQKSKNLRITI